MKRKLINQLADRFDLQRDLICRASGFKLANNRLLFVLLALISALHLSASKNSLKNYWTGLGRNCKVRDTAEINQNFNLWPQNQKNHKNLLRKNCKLRHVVCNSFSGQLNYFFKTFIIKMFDLFYLIKSLIFINFPSFRSQIKILIRMCWLQLWKIWLQTSFSCY